MCGVSALLRVLAASCLRLGGPTHIFHALHCAGNDAHALRCALVESSTSETGRTHCGLVADLPEASSQAGGHGIRSRGGVGVRSYNSGVRGITSITVIITATTEVESKRLGLQTLDLMDT
ncbi:MAG: hypothetical protein GY811_04755 [Myxococcales bacterium]|nr:hypothetical protein [Myxococcales bacterium]